MEGVRYVTSLMRAALLPKAGGGEGEGEGEGVCQLCEVVNANFLRLAIHQA